MPRQYNPRHMTEYICDACGTRHLRATAQGRRYKKHYCSIVCRTKGHRGATHPQWSGGRLQHPNGYVRITLPFGGTVWEHRWVWEQSNGPIPKDCHIHHINGDRADNRIENLRCLTHLEHLRLHHLGKPKPRAKRAG